jgi:hypothetical protein
VERVVEVKATRLAEVVEVGEFGLRGGRSVQEDKKRRRGKRTSTEGLLGPVGTGGMPNSDNASSCTPATCGRCCWGSNPLPFPVAAPTPDHPPFLPSSSFSAGGRSVARSYRGGLVDDSRRLPSLAAEAEEGASLTPERGEEERERDAVAAPLMRSMAAVTGTSQKGQRVFQILEREEEDEQAGEAVERSMEG